MTTMPSGATTAPDGIVLSGLNRDEMTMAQGDKLVPCPRGCGTWVGESQAGKPHTIYETGKPSRVCKD